MEISKIAQAREPDRPYHAPQAVVPILMFFFQSAALLSNKEGDNQFFGILELLNFDLEKVAGGGTCSVQGWAPNTTQHNTTRHDTTQHPRQ